VVDRGPWASSSSPRTLRAGIPAVQAGDGELPAVLAAASGPDGGDRRDSRMLLFMESFCVQGGGRVDQMLSW